MTTTIPAQALEVGDTFGYNGEFIVTEIGPMDDGVFRVAFTADGKPASRFMAVGERIVVPA